MTYLIEKQNKKRPKHQTNLLSLFHLNIKSTARFKRKIPPTIDKTKMIGRLLMLLVSRVVKKKNKSLIKILDMNGDLKRLF